MISEKNVHIDLERLINNIELLGRIGQNKNGGIDRAFGSNEDLLARKWIKDYWQTELSGEVYTDAIGNMSVMYSGKKDIPPIVLGSHHDAVPDGGKYDGALGVLLATEIIQTLQQEKIVLNHPVKAVSFTAEEPNPFNISTLGSKVIASRVTKEDLQLLSNRITGESLEMAIKNAGGDLDNLECAIWNRKDAAAFMECHIEQGKRLERQNKSTAVVSCITGIYREQYEFFGEANHAGTTIMQERKDAYLASCELSLAIEKIAKEFEDDQFTATVGYVNVYPNEANIIPGNVIMLMDCRVSNKSQKELFVKKIMREIESIQFKRNIIIRRKVILDQHPQVMDEKVMHCIEMGIRKTGEEPTSLVSMAGHDAANIAKVTKSGMIFVQSVDGKSHCRQEYTKKEDIKKVADAMLYALIMLDKELDL